MKKNLKFLLLAPCLMAILCEDATDQCGLEEAEAYELNVENISETYSQNEIIWLNAQTSSMIIDNCTATNEPELILETEVFLDGIFVLKLNDNLEGLNADISQNVIVNYNIGETYNFNGCNDAIDYLPILTDDNLFYEYRIGVSIETPGDYCIVSSRDSNFNITIENNAQVFNNYNNLDNNIKFESCGTVYTRNGTDGHYFFRIE